MLHKLIQFLKRLFWGRAKKEQYEVEVKKPKYDKVFQLRNRYNNQKTQPSNNQKKRCSKGLHEYKPIFKYVKGKKYATIQRVCIYCGHKHNPIKNKLKITGS